MPPHQRVKPWSVIPLLLCAFFYARSAPVAVVSSVCMCVCSCVHFFPLMFMCVYVRKTEIESGPTSRTSIAACCARMHSRSDVCVCVRMFVCGPLHWLQCRHAKPSTSPRHNMALRLEWERTREKESTGPSTNINMHYTRCGRRNDTKRGEASHVPYIEHTTTQQTLLLCRDCPLNSGVWVWVCLWTCVYVAVCVCVCEHACTRADGIVLVVCCCCYVPDTLKHMREFMYRWVLRPVQRRSLFVERKRSFTIYRIN